MKNPFCPVAEFPDFPAMTPEAADEAFPQLLADARAAVDRLEREAVPTWCSAWPQTILQANGLFACTIRLQVAVPNGASRSLRPM